MKIIHVCLAAFYIEGWEYQENVLTRCHSQQGHEVTVITSNKIFDVHYQPTIRKNMDYVNEYNVHVISLQRNLNYVFFSKFGLYEKLYEELFKLKPDIIFVHGGQFLSLKDIVKYCHQNSNVRLYIDQHGDYYNMPIETLKQKIIHKVIYGFYFHKAISVCKKFWGVTPWRCQYLHEVYRIPKEKIGLLLMGGDDSKIHFDKSKEIRIHIRKSLDIDLNDFVLITGGKINREKNIDKLIKAVMESSNKKLKLLVFGEPNKEMKIILDQIKIDYRIIFLGWQSPNDIYNLFLASDLAVFPGTHSVLWEQACATGLPCVFRDWLGMHHVDLNGNCVMLKNITVDGIKNIIDYISKNKDIYLNMKKKSMDKCVPLFSYNRISREAIEEDIF